MDKPKPVKSRRAGFTLLEITIVFALIGFFSAYMLGTVIVTSQRRARDTHRKTDLSNLGKAFEFYFNDYNSFPDADPQGRVLGCGAAANTACTWGGVWEGANATVYMNPMPADPQDPAKNYFYRVSADGLGWELYAQLEIEDDAAIGDYDYNCGSESSCNYRIVGGRPL